MRAAASSSSRAPVIGDRGKDQVIFRLVERFDAEEGKRQPARFPDQRFQDRNLAFVLFVGEADFGTGKFAVLGLRHNRLRQRMIRAVEVGITGAAREFVKPEGDVAGRRNERARSLLSGNDESFTNSAWSRNSCRVSCISRRS